MAYASDDVQAFLTNMGGLVDELPPEHSAFAGLLRELMTIIDAQQKSLDAYRLVMEVMQR